MTERGDTPDDTQVRTTEAETAAGQAPEVTQSEGAQAVAEGATEAVDPAPAPGAVPEPAPVLDESAATPDKQGPAEAVTDAADDRPELFVAGAFLGGLALALILRRVAGD